MNASQGHPQVLKAALWMTGAIASFTSMAIAGRAVSFKLNTFELMTYRSFVGLLIVLAVATARGKLGEIRARRLDLHLVRNLFHFTGQNLWFWAITVIPLAQVFALEFTSPLWVTLFAPLLLSERLSPNRALAAAVGFVGILIVARPDLGHLNPGIIAAAAAAIGFAGSALFTKLLTRTQPVTSILFWMTVTQSLFGLVTANWHGPMTLPDATTAPWLILIGIAGLLAHFCLTNALSVAPASIVMPIDFARLPVIAIIAMVVYGEPLDGYVFLGAAIIFAANYFNIWVETRPRRARA